MKQYLFTYGMLTNRDVMDPDARLVGAAVLRDWRFEMLTFANVHPAVGEVAEGVLWEVNDFTLEDCDFREGFPTLYDREMVSVEVDGRHYGAWVYTLTESGRSSYVKGSASRHYVTTVTEGYLQHGVSVEQLARAA